jgi:hypothetical protein
MGFINKRMEIRISQIMKREVYTINILLEQINVIRKRNLDNKMARKKRLKQKKINQISRKNSLPGTLISCE